MSKNLSQSNSALQSIQNTNQNQIIMYRPDDTISLNVRLENETVWLTQIQIAELFGVKQPAISKHISNIYSSGELSENGTYSILEYMGNDGRQKYITKYYNLDVILSVGYRVNSVNATRFRQWANKVLKEYLLRGYAVNQRVNQLEDKVDRRFADYDQKIEHLNQQVDFFVKTSLPPKEKVFFDGQLFDAHVLMSQLVESAEKRIVLIDNYIDDTVLTILSKRADGVEATIYTGNISKPLQLDIDKHNAQYPLIEVRTFSRAHDRFLIIDDAVYLVGASIKDLGKKWFGFTMMENTDAEKLLNMMM